MTEPARIALSCSPGEIRAGVTDAGGRLIDCAIWRPGAPDGVGAIHRARITAREPALAGSFADIGGGVTGFLPDSAAPGGHPEGAHILAAVSRASQHEKGPRLAACTHPVVPPDWLSGPARMLAPGRNPVEEIAERFPAAPILCDDAAVAAVLPCFATRLVLVASAFDDSLEEAFESLAAPRVTLAGGAVLHVSPTPALTALDLDSAGATAANRPKTAAQASLNRGLMPQVARQIRLRNLSGPILLDAAGIPAARRARLLSEALAAALGEDPLRPRLLGFTALGFAEILRPRIRPALHELLGSAHGAGLAALRRLVREVDAAPHQAVGLRCGLGVAAALERDEIAQEGVARRTGRPLMLRPDPTLPPGETRLEPA